MLIKLKKASIGFFSNMRRRLYFICSGYFKENMNGIEYSKLYINVALLSLMLLVKAYLITKGLREINVR